MPFHDVSLFLLMDSEIGALLSVCPGLLPLLRRNPNFYKSQSLKNTDNDSSSITKVVGIAAPWYFSFSS